MCASDASVNSTCLLIYVLRFVELYLLLPWTELVDVRLGVFLIVLVMVEFSFSVTILPETAVSTPLLHGCSRVWRGTSFYWAYYSRQGMTLQLATVSAISWSCWHLYYCHGGITLKLTASQYQKIGQKSMKSHRHIKKYSSEHSICRHYSIVCDGNTITSEIYMSL